MQQHVRPPPLISGLEEEVLQLSNEILAALGAETGIQSIESLLIDEFYIQILSEIFNDFDFSSVQPGMTQIQRAENINTLIDLIG